MDRSEDIRSAIPVMPALDDIRFSDFIEVAPDALIIVDAQGQIIMVNEQAEQLFGYARQDLIGQPLAILIPHRFHHRHWGHLGGYFQHPRKRPMGQSLNLFGLRQDGTEFPVEISLSPFQTPNGMVTISAIRDSTERKRLEAQAREGQHARELNAVFEAMADGVFIYDAQGNIILSNRAGREMFPTPAHLETLLVPAEGTLGQARLTYRQLPRDMLPVSRALKGEILTGADTIDFVVRANDGEEIFCNASAAPIYDERGTISGAVTVIRDVSERFRIEQLKDDFINIASHELRTPITGLKLAVGLIRRRLSKVTDQEEILRCLNEITTYTARMNYMVNDMLDLTRIHSGRFSIDTASCDITSVIRSAVEEQGHLANRTIILQGADHPIIGLIDVHRIRQVVTNLLSNAVKYSPSDTDITVMLEAYAHAGRSWIRCSVQDQGQGIAEHHRAHLFERYYRAIDAGYQFASQHKEGVGLGLYISRAILQAHGGSIGVESTLGKGSTFSFELPIS